jgi:hypothetical protein
MHSRVHRGMVRCWFPAVRRTLNLHLSCWPARSSVACARRWTTLSGRSARVFVSRVIAGASIEHRDAGLASKSGWNHRWSDSRHMNPRVWAADGQLVPVVAARAPTTEVERAVDTRCRCAHGADGVHHPVPQRHRIRVPPPSRAKSTRTEGLPSTVIRASRCDVDPRRGAGARH